MTSTRKIIIVLMVAVALMTGAIYAITNHKEEKTVSEITAATFVANAKKQKLSPRNTLKNYTSYKAIEAAYEIAPRTESYIIDFYVLSDEAYAKSMFDQNDTPMKSKPNYKTSTKDGVSISTTEQRYRYTKIIKVGHNFVKGTTLVENKSQLDKVLKALGF